jgi:predicted acyl esterase
MIMKTHLNAVWRDEPAWPLARATQTTYYLHSDVKANFPMGFVTILGTE